MDEEVEASPVVKRTPWPVRLCSIEEQRKRGDESPSLVLVINDTKLLMPCG